MAPSRTFFLETVFFVSVFVFIFVFVFVMCLRYVPYESVVSPSF